MIYLTLLRNEIFYICIFHKKITNVYYFQHQEIKIYNHFLIAVFSGCITYFLTSVNCNPWRPTERMGLFCPCPLFPRLLYLLHGWGTFCLFRTQQPPSRRTETLPPLTLATLWPMTLTTEKVAQLKAGIANNDACKM